jgi:hypothetical protein
MALAQTSPDLQITTVRNVETNFLMFATHSLRWGIFKSNKLSFSNLFFVFKSYTIQIASHILRSYRTMILRLLTSNYLATINFKVADVFLLLMSLQK